MTTTVMDPAEAAVRILIAQQAGRSFEQAGVPVTPQNRKVWGELLASVASLPDAAMLDIPSGLLPWSASVGFVAKSQHVRADGIVAAGLAVRAKSTGRVLMIQRAADPSVCPCGMPLAWGLDDGDWWSHSDGSVSHDKSYGGKSVSDLVGTSAPDSAAGKWEFPGGRLDPGEEPLDAARREWSEETGLDVPSGEPVGAWKHGNYIGYVISVPNEESVPILDRSKGANPDDPDNEEPEAIAWWDPRELKDNPVVREELRDKPKRIKRALDAVSVEKQLSTGPFLVKVGPEGFVHGWRFVGVPSGAPVAESTGKNAYDAIRSADELDLTQAQRDVVKDYTGMDFNNLNAYLRHGTQWPGAAQRIAMMNDVFDKSDPTKEPLMVRRFIESNAANDLFGPIGSRTGKSYTDKGYSSTTAHPGHFWDSADTVLHIHVPEGTKVIKPGPQTCHDVREQEIILPAGLKGTVISDEIVNGARTIHVAARW